MKALRDISIYALLKATLTTATAIYKTRAYNDSSNDPTTSSIIPHGALVDHCVIPGTVALTFDDGPFWYTNDLLEILSEYGAPATFFVNGHNLGDVYESSDVLQRVVQEGHQLGSHTYASLLTSMPPGMSAKHHCVHSWGHTHLAGLDYPAIVAQMTELEAAFEQVLGFVPAYMRPPYLAFNTEVLAAMTDLGYHVIGASIDTKDYENDDPDLIMNSVEKFRAELGDGGAIVLAHDVHQQTVYTLAREMLEEIFARGLQRIFLSPFIFFWMG